MRLIAKPSSRFESGTLYWESRVLTTFKCKCPVIKNRQFFFFIWGTKKMVDGRVRQVVVFIVTIVWELAWAHAALVVLDE